MIVRVEEREVPEPVAAHQRAPLRGIGGIDVVVLTEPVQRERDREDEEDRDDVGARAAPPPANVQISASTVRCAAIDTLRSSGDALLQRGRIGRALLPRRAEIDREQRRRAVQQLEPARVDLRRQVMPLGIVFVGSELGVMIEMPAGELARGDAARHGVEPAQRALRGRTPALEDRVVHDLVQQHREVEDGESLHEGQRNPDQRVRRSRSSAQVVSARIANWRAATSQMTRRRPSRGTRAAASRGSARPSSVRSARRVLAVMMRFHGTYDPNCT